MNKIDLNKKYKTRSGLEVKLCPFYMKGIYKVLGVIIDQHGQEEVCRWDELGRVFLSFTHEKNLIEVKEKKGFWVNFYKGDNEAYLYKFKEDADKYGGEHRTACIYVEFEEGQGL